ncbi:MAG: hypothetical protein JNL01_02700 [Bdellovibrionales bacterium]|nr:hypothetical protein [Bdellovibrionales bacterium]
MKNIWIASLLLASVFPLGAWAAKPLFETFSFTNVTAFPKELFTKESTPVTFYAQFAEPVPTGKRLAVVEMDPESGKVIRYVGALIDDGVLGDRKKNDGVFSRKMQLTEKMATTKTFAVVEENEAGYPLTLSKDYPHQLQIKILRRPSFVELVTAAVSKLWNGQKHSSN